MIGFFKILLKSNNQVFAKIQRKVFKVDETMFTIVCVILLLSVLSGKILTM
jgi:hypothetical protein